jgi:hypothetical protein
VAATPPDPKEVHEPVATRTVEKSVEQVGST